MNNQISNPKTSVPTGIQLNDKDYINCLLSTLKEMTKNYALAMTEASNEVLYQKYKNIFNSVSDLQRETFELAFRNGWYILEQAESQKISNKLNTLTQEYQDLNL